MLESCTDSFCWKMGWALDRFSGFLITPSPSVSTSQISFYASKKPIGQKCCMSCLDQFTEFVYLRYRPILNQFATDTKIQSPQSSRFGPDGRLVVPGMRPNATRVLLAVALAATLQWARTPVFARQRARSGHMTHRRVADEPSPVLNAMQDPNFQAAVTSAWVFVESTLTPAAELVQSLGQVQEFARTWGEQEPFEGKDADKHVEELTGAIEKTIAAGKNVLIPTAQDADLPLEPIRGTPFEKLMVATLQNTSMAGVYALHAEPGAGKSTAAMLGALELKGRRPKDVIVVLQNDLDRQLESFFCLSIKFTAEIARPFFAMLRGKGIRLRLILDNVLDSTSIIEQSGDRLRVLARAANDNLHQVIVIVQSETAAKDIGDLNGDTTRKGNQMPAVWYRWSREETLELLNRISDIQELLEKQLGYDGEAEERNVLLAEALERSEIPDKYGCWRPRSTTRYIMTGDRPIAPLPIPGGAHQDGLVNIPRGSTGLFL